MPGTGQGQKPEPENPGLGLIVHNYAFKFPGFWTCVERVVAVINDVSPTEFLQRSQFLWY